MGLSNDLISQFVKATKDEDKTKKETTVYGTIVKYNDSNYVKLDGSEFLTPVYTTTEYKTGERVAVLLKNHSATVTGNISSPSARSGTVKEISDKVSEFGTIIANKVDTTELNAEIARIDALYADNAVIGEKLTANEAEISDLKANKLDAESAKILYANIDFSNIGKAAMEYFYANSGLIQNVTINDGTITGNLIGVTISGDLIEGNTIVAEKLVIKGSDGLYYKLNTDGITTEAEQTDYNSLNGSIIKAKSITATKISVSDLVAFDATIGGFNITDTSIYSGVKESANNTTRGIYLDKEGQLSIGDSNSFLKYYKDQNGEYKLEISAGSITINTIGRTIESAINDLDNLQIGGRNLLLGTTSEYQSINTSQWYAFIFEYPNKYNLLDDFDLKPGDTITYSVLVNGGEYGARANLAFHSDTSGSNRTSFYGPIIPAGEEGSSFVTTVIPEGAAYISIAIASGDNTQTSNTAQYKCPKLEIGNKPTAWTVAQEDLESGINGAQSSANDASTLASTAYQATLDIKDMISTLVTDSNGTSVMTQNGDGWTFSTSEIEETVNSISERLDELSNIFSDANQTVNILNESLSDISKTFEYVRISTYEEEPCIELGENDSSFKLIITNTRIMFMDGPNISTYMNSEGLTTENISVNNELRQGNFVWTVRSNGNYCLQWKEETE